MLSQSELFSPVDPNPTLADRRLLIVGNRGGTNVGASLERAASSLGISVRLMEMSRAMEGPPWLRLLKWHLMQHTPTRLVEFSQAVFQCCETWKPYLLLTTGTAPVMRKTLAQARSLGIRCCNYSTDDPWNAEHRSRWFLQALSEYDFIFTPRCANLKDLTRVSSGVVSRVSFGYDPDLFFPEHLTADEARQFASDIVFAGGADQDRVPYISSLHSAGIRVALYGSYWERFSETRPLTKGQADIATLRKAVAGSSIVLCLVRRANRDSHAMRSYEAPAMRACMVVEKTGDHLDLFGPEGQAVLYFHSVSEMIEKVSWLLERPAERRRLAENSYRLVVSGGHTYRKRLQTMLAAVDCGV